MSRSAADIRDTFLRFFEAKGHRRVASSPLVPESDPTLLFTNAGMVQFKRTFLGEEQRDYSTATSSQKCMRVSGKHNDLENVGRTPRHHTFFEMLGNFSFGDYFKRDAIAHAWELLTQEYRLSADNLVVSVFREDDEAFEIWRDDIGLPEAKIYRLDEDENFWSMGDTGPCGPCSEIHYDFRPDEPYATDDPSSETGRFLEIWNLVFMQFDRDANGTMTPLPKPSIDTGAGLERIAAVLQGVRSNYETDLFTPLIAHAEDLSGVRKGEDPEKDVSLNVVADHARALTFLIGDGILPSNEGRGYVLRRILRRASRHGVLLGKEEPFLFEIAGTVINEMASAYPELAERKAFIQDRIQREETRFLETLTVGLSLLEEAIAKVKDRGERTLPGEVVFKLYDTFGFPIDLTADILVGHEMELDQTGFDTAMEAQRTRARAAWKGSGDASVDEIYGVLAAEHKTHFSGYDALDVDSTIRALILDGESRISASMGDRVEVVVDDTSFYAESGGQVGDRGRIETQGGSIEIDDVQRPSGELVVHRGRVATGEIQVDTPATLRVDPESRAATVRNHSGTHLLHAALREVVGPQAMQKGSLVSPERLRFDFTHDAPLSDENLERIEDLTNEWIEANARANVRQMAYPEAIEAGAIAIFEEKYGDEVRVISFGNFSTELCGGTHAAATGEIGLLKIVSESGIASGVRRIEALTGQGALAHMREQQHTLARLSELLKAPVTELPVRVEKLLEERKSADQEIAKLRAEQRGAASADLTSQVREVGDIRVLSTRVEGVAGKELRTLVDDLRDKVKSGVVLIAAVEGERVTLALGVTPDLKDRFKAGDLIREVAALVGGKGGGRPDFAQAGGNDASQLDAAFEKLDALLAEG